MTVPPSLVTLWEVKSTSGKPVICVLSLSPRMATLSVLIDGSEIVVERFPVETDARRYAKTLYADFIGMGCVDPLKADDDEPGGGFV